ELPAITIEPLDFVLPELDRYAWLVFTSANGARLFFDRGLAASGLDARALAAARVAAIGPGTAEVLAARGIAADLVPERFVAESLVEAFPPPTSTEERVLLSRAANARDVLPQGLRSLGYEVEVLPVYRTVRAEPDPDDVALVQKGQVDAVT